MAPQTDVPVLKNLSGLKAWYSVNIFQSPSIWWMFWDKMGPGLSSAHWWGYLWALLVVGCCGSWRPGSHISAGQAKMGTIKLHLGMGFLFPWDIQSYCISSNTISLRGIEFPWLTAHSPPFVPVKFKISASDTFLLTEYLTGFSFNICRWSIYLTFGK